MPLRSDRAEVFKRPIAAPGYTDLEGNSLTAASNGTLRGTVLRQAAQANSTAVDVAGLVTDFNALLAKLRAAGVIAP